MDGQFANIIANFLNHFLDFPFRFSFANLINTPHFSSHFQPLNLVMYIQKILAL
jgi:hypothetical protein